MTSYGTIKLVDYRDRTLCTLPLRDPKRAERELYAAINRWRDHEAVGGYVHDDTGKLLAYG